MKNGSEEHVVSSPVDPDRLIVYLEYAQEEASRFDAIAGMLVAASINRLRELAAQIKE